MPFLRVLLLILCGIALPSRAHVVDQMFSEWQESDEGWRLVVQFDAGYADPETRDDPVAPPPSRDWLLEQSEESWREMREEAERYFRRSFQVEVNGRLVDWQVHFPDWESRSPDWQSSPPDFPKLLNGVAYFRMEITGPEPGRVTLAIAEGDFPKLVVQREQEFLVIAPGERKELREGGGAWVWLREGFRHVVPLGWDHVLFVLGLFFYRRRLRDLVHQSLAFTVAHSLTLAWAAAGWFVIPASWGGGLEVLIALSLVLVGLENLRKERKLPVRLLLVFTLGLLHGLGFAGALANFVDREQLFFSVGMLNLGVELAQIALLAAAWLLTMGWSEKPNYEKARKGGSILIAIMGACWAVSRLMA